MRRRDRDADGSTGAGPRRGPAASRRSRWLARPSARVVGSTVLATFAVVFATPADGGAGTLAVRIAHVVGLGPASSQNGQPFGGTPAVGALFTTSSGRLGAHYCTASVVQSPQANLLVTAAHCVSGRAGTIVFVPGYANGREPYGVWHISGVYTDPAWNASAGPDDDVAFLTVAPDAASTPIADVTGAEQLGIGWPEAELVKVIGYPNGAREPVICQNWTRTFSATQMEFDCGGYPEGTSGGPFLARVNPATGQGAVIGVIGGYQQGGDEPDISYSAVLGASVRALYQQATAGR